MSLVGRFIILVFPNFILENLPRLLLFTKVPIIYNIQIQENIPILFLFTKVPVMYNKQIQTFIIKSSKDIPNLTAPTITSVTTITHFTCYNCNSKYGNLTT